MSDGPRVIGAYVGPFNINVTVVFDGYMSYNENLINPYSYLLSHGAYVVSVDAEDCEDRVILTVENLYGRDNFDLFVSCDIMDCDGYNIDSNFNYANISYESVASFSGATGTLKTRDEINKLYEDDDNWYVATSGGLDIIDKEYSENKGYVLDAYGVNAVTVGDGYVYFSQDSDCAGSVYKVEISNATGNMSDCKIDDISYPTIQSQKINALEYGNNAGDGILVVATDSGVTVSLENTILQYGSGNDIGSVCVASGGTTLYTANNTLGRVDVYYDIHVDIIGRIEPDAYYDITEYTGDPNTYINQIKVVDDSSMMDPYSNVIYVATDSGLVRIESDESSPGVSESGSVSFTYGIDGGDLLFNILGGQTNNVVAVDVNMDLLQIFVLTSEQSKSGGMTIINIPSNTRFSFRSYEQGTLISDDLRDITCKR
jgi:hypothetical protein